jgi:hypothetical protein
MGFIVLLVVAIAALVGYQFLPTVIATTTNITQGTAASGTPLASMTDLIWVGFAIIIAIGVIWFIMRNG